MASEHVDGVFHQYGVQQAVDDPGDRLLATGRSAVR